MGGRGCIVGGRGCIVGGRGCIVGGRGCIVGGRGSDFIPQDQVQVYTHRLSDAVIPATRIASPVLQTYLSKLKEGI